MLRRISMIGFLIVCFALASGLATAQNVIHATVGTVDAIDTSAKTIVVTEEDGTSGKFEDLSDSKARVDIDKALRAATTPAPYFTAKGTSAIVLFYTEGALRTAVALRDIGPGPFTRSSGTVVKFGGKERSVSLKTETGNVETFKLIPETVVETSLGAVSVNKFDPYKGDQLRVVSGLVNGSPTALFISTD
jgi:hypothetical protein